MKYYSNNIDKIYNNINRNAKSSSPSRCYYICANKEKLEILKRPEPQIIYGRRGTGKTTLLKSFLHMINEVEKDHSLQVAWYVSLDDCTPTPIAYEESEQRLLALTLKNFTQKLIDFFYERLEKLEKYTSYQKLINLPNLSDQSLRINIIINHLSDLEQLINQGTPTPEFYCGKETVEKGNHKSIKGDLSLDIKKLGFEGYANATGEKQVKKTLEKAIKYSFDISAIRSKICQIIDAFSYQYVYILIDEFYQIDKEINYSLQSSFAQIIKMLLFGNEKIIVKIANVWNESKIQSKQFGGKREGLELGHDIFENKELDLDTMFECDNEKAYRFFSTMLINYSRLNDVQMLMNSYNDTTVKNILDSMFSKDALNYLICGSQGIPRIFGNIFTECVYLLRENGGNIFTSNIICQGIIEHYKTNVRASIPNSHPLCIAIEDYVSDSKNRFFLVHDSIYNIGINFFDGLVAKTALHQYPSTQVPRKLRNRYKVFFVHYGNYLEAVTPDPLKTISLEGKLKDYKLYPNFSDDLMSNTKHYILSIDNKIFDTNYCDNCHIFYLYDQSTKNKCPKCNNISRFWSC